MTITSNRLSSIYVLDQDEALDFYVGVLGLEVATDADLGFMRWLTVRVPGDTKEILLERPGPPAHDPATAEEVRALVTKGAGGGWLGFNTDDVDGLYDEARRTGCRDHPGADGSVVRTRLRTSRPVRQQPADRPDPRALRLTEPEPVARAQSPGRGGSCPPHSRLRARSTAERSFHPAPKCRVATMLFPVLRRFPVQVCAACGCAVRRSRPGRRAAAPRPAAPARTRRDGDPRWRRGHGCPGPRHRSRARSPAGRHRGTPR